MGSGLPSHVKPLQKCLFCTGGVCLELLLSVWSCHCTFGRVTVRLEVSLTVWKCLFGAGTVCLEVSLSVWKCLFGGVTVCLEGTPVSRKDGKQTGLLKVFKTVPKPLGIGNFLVPGLPSRVKPLQKCLLGSIFLHGLGE